MGKLFGNLTNPGVTDPSSGLTQQTSGPGAAGMLQGAMAAKTAQPVSMNLEGDAAGDQTSYGFDKPPQVGPQPKQVMPSFLNASHSGKGGMASPLSSQLTTKGKILASVLQIGLGGAAGWAAGRQGNPREGYAGPAAGFQAGMQLPFFQAQQKQAAQRGELENQVLQNQVQYAPLLRQLGLDKTQSEISKNKALTGLSDARTTALQNPQAKPPKDAFALWQKDNPNGTYADFQKASAAGKPEPKPDPLDQQFDAAVSSGDIKRSKQLLNEKAALAAAGKDPSAQNAARADRSYQYHSTRVDKLRQPIESQMDRLARLQGTVYQGTPQADSLIAPELLTAMAGGQGSGLRMNEAEISRIVGGRSNWESIKAAANKWQADPTKALSITPAQREQIQALIDTTHDRLGAKLQAIDEESQNLASSDNPQQHRLIYNRLQKRLSTADTQIAKPDNDNRKRRVIDLTK